ncbi:MAG: putative dehydrogenase [Pirellulaceae bacterium]
MSNLKIAVIGGGRLGSIHARLLESVEGVSLVAIVDPDPAAQRRHAETHNVPIYANPQSLIGIVDAAIIATPTVLHHDVAVPLLQNNIHLLIEKPITATVVEATRLIQLAEANNLILQVGHVERFNPALNSVIDRLDSPRYLQATRSSNYTCRSTDIGVVLDLMIHDIDIVLSLVAGEVTHVEAVGNTVFGPHEDTAHARLQFSCGAVATLNASRVSPVPERTLQIHDRNGQVYLDFGNHSVVYAGVSDQLREGQVDVNALSADGKTAIQDNLWSEFLPKEEIEVQPANAILEEQLDFVQSVRSGNQPRVTGIAGRNALEVADAIVEQIQNYGWSSRRGNRDSSLDWTRRRAG